MTDAEWTWPDPPTTPRDVIAGHCRNWGKALAYSFADTLLTELSISGFQVVPEPKPKANPSSLEREKER